jgi:hypothetical protein
MYVFGVNLSVNTIPFPEHNQLFHLLIGTTGALCEILKFYVKLLRRQSLGPSVLHYFPFCAILKRRHTA